MNLVFDQPYGPVNTVLHPTDLSEASLSAFHHALAVAIYLGAELTLLHAVGRGSKNASAEFPQVRDTLARWRAAGTTRSLEERIRNVRIRKLEAPTRDPLAAFRTYVHQNRVDMIVLATGQRTGFARLVRPSQAEALARESHQYTLFVPAGSRPLVSAETGAVTLSRILLPVDPETDPRPAMLRAVQSATLLDDPDLEVTLLHVCGESESPPHDVPTLPFCRWTAMARSAPDPTAGILEVAEEIGADAIFMSSSWQKPGLTRKVGGVTEGVLSHAGCPVAVVPVGGPA